MSLPSLKLVYADGSDVLDATFQNGSLVKIVDNGSTVPYDNATYKVRITDGSFNPFYLREVSIASGQTESALFELMVSQELPLNAYSQAVLNTGLSYYARILNFSQQDALGVIFSGKSILAAAPSQIAIQYLGVDYAVGSNTLTSVQAGDDMTFVSTLGDGVGYAMAFVNAVYDNITGIVTSQEVAFTLGPMDLQAGTVYAINPGLGDQANVLFGVATDESGTQLNTWIQPVSVVAIVPPAEPQYSLAGYTANQISNLNAQVGSIDQTVTTLTESVVNVEALAQQGVDGAVAAQASADQAIGDAAAALSAAGTAQTDAASALLAAQTAQSDASAALGAAATAQSAADAAAQEATAASSAASAAQGTADQAVLDAASASSAASAAQSTANQAAIDAGNAGIAASAAQGTADQAVLDAAAASSAASAAQSTADNAQTDATQALSDAADALGVAQAAGLAAEAAQGTANGRASSSIALAFDGVVALPVVPSTPEAEAVDAWRNAELTTPGLGPASVLVVSAAAAGEEIEVPFVDAAPSGACYRLIVPLSSQHHVSVRFLSATGTAFLAECVNGGSIGVVRIAGAYYSVDGF